MKIDLTDSTQFSMVNAIAKANPEFEKKVIIKALKGLKSFNDLLAAIKHAKKAGIRLSQAAEALQCSKRKEGAK